MAQNMDKWGKATAKSRYGSGPKEFSPPQEQCYPQFKEDQQAQGYNNDASGWVRGKGQNPCFKRGP